VQLAIFEAAGAAPPAFGHHSLLIGGDGQALSKRLGALSMQSFRDEGFEPLAVLSHAALVGTSDAIEPMKSRDDLAAKLDFAKISTAPARFDVAELRSLNGKLLHMLDYVDVSERLRALGISGGEDFWQVIRGNIALLAEARLWWDIVSSEIEPIIEDPKIVAAAAEALPQEPWGERTWSDWTAATKSATGAKGRALFHPLRMALTARESGPELKALLPLMGRKRVLARLEGKRA
jgi:glutamyl-tRNA synthetase